MLLTHTSPFTAIYLACAASITLRFIRLILAIDMAITSPIRWNAPLLIAQKSRTRCNRVNFIQMFVLRQKLNFYLVSVLAFSLVVPLSIQCKRPDHCCQSIFYSSNNPADLSRKHQRRIHIDGLFLYGKDKKEIECQLINSMEHWSMLATTKISICFCRLNNLHEKLKN